MLKDAKNFGAAPSKKFLLVWQMNKFDDRALSTAHVAKNWDVMVLTFHPVNLNTFCFHFLSIFFMGGYLGNGNWGCTYSWKGPLFKTCFTTSKEYLSDMHYYTFLLVKHKVYITLLFIRKGKHARLGCVIKKWLPFWVPAIDYFSSNCLKQNDAEIVSLSEWVK